MRRRAALLVLLAAPLALRAPAEGGAAPVELAVIVNPKNSVARLGTAELADIFTGTRRVWSDGQAIAPFNLEPGDPLRVAFDRAALGMGPDEVGRYWVDQRIRGGGAKPPRQLEDASIMLRIVAKLPGAIGYVPAAQVDATVKVVARVRGGEVVAP